MDIRKEAMTAQARDTLNALRTGLQHRSTEVKTAWSRAALAAIRDARARLAQLEPIVAAWAQTEAQAAEVPEGQGSATTSSPTDPSAAAPAVAPPRPEHTNGKN